MTENQIEHTGGIRGPRRFRYLIDIIALVVVTFVLDAVLGAFVQVPINLEKGFILDAIGKMFLVGVGCHLVLLRGERLSDIGLKRPESWARTFAIRWVHERRSAVLALPSAISPADTNFLLNPEHRDFKRIRVAPPVNYDFDSRLLGR